ncbi:hypothetical protein [Clostridium sp.]|jgi:hypothetical protein|uniref:hypothetical protein n=1 Tax=Clostridium sp. TaxID=1506 RepID=UPI0025C698B2|nr:hypothetical protein [Clostridium sp.]MCI9069525.1 hypothetical protein [Clostridium sp.]MCI9303017.1 hypothetical protein [Clostridium sp.]
MKKCENNKNKTYKSKKKNNNFNLNNDKANNEKERNELIKQIGISNLSEFGIALIIYAAILNILYLEWQKTKILDQLNSTNYAETLQDLTEVPKGANVIYLFVTSIFTGVLFDNYKTALSQTGENRNEKEINDSYKRIVAILLMLLGTTINFEILNC